MTLTLALAYSMLACSGGGDSSARVEGTQGGDCQDGADNDADGAFDCEDDGCTGSPDCADTDSDSDTNTNNDTASDSDSDTDTDSDSDTDSGWTVCASGGAPFTEIQDAVDAAADGDVIRVCGGTYEYVEMNRKVLTLVGAGTAETIVDGGIHTALTVDSSTLTISGFTLTGAPGAGEVGGLHIVDSSLAVDDVRFAANDASTCVEQERTEAVWERVVFEDNDALAMSAWDGGSLVLRHSVFRDNRDGLLTVNTTSYEVANNLFYGNDVPANAPGAAFYVGSGLAWVYNNLWWGNDHHDAQYLVYPGAGVLFENNIVADTLGGGIEAYDPADGIAYNDAYGNSGDDWATNHGDAPPDTNLTADARLVDPAAGDFTLTPGFSPCIDAGDPLSGYNDVDGTRNDMGAYGGPAGSW